MFLFFDLTFQYVLHFGRSKFVFPSTVLLGAIRPKFWVVPFLSVIRNCVSITKIIVQSKHNNIIFNNVTFVAYFVYK